MTQIIYSQNAEETSVTVFSIQDFRWEFYCEAFGVETMEGLFDNATDVQAIPLIQDALDRIDANPTKFKALSIKNRPPEYKSFRQLRAEIESMMKFLEQFPGSTINGSYTDPDNP